MRFPGLVLLCWGKVVLTRIRFQSKTNTSFSPFLPPVSLKTMKTHTQNGYFWIWRPKRKLRKRNKWKHSCERRKRTLERILRPTSVDSHVINLAIVRHVMGMDHVQTVLLGLVTVQLNRPSNEILFLLTSEAYRSTRIDSVHVELLLSRGNHTGAV